MLKNMLVTVILMTLFAGAALAIPSDCEECHAKITPNLVADFNRGVMSEEMDCTGCHGDSHKGNDDVDQALLPTIETCAEWVTPYLGDLVGYRPLHGVVPPVASLRAEVAHTIALRRRKGTTLVLEQLARDVTGWSARAVEFFDLLVATQYMNHPRAHSLRCPDLRKGEALEWIGRAFETASRNVDVRNIESGRGSHNIPNVGLFLWRIESHSRRMAPAVRVSERFHSVDGHLILAGALGKLLHKFEDNSMVRPKRNRRKRAIHQKV